MVDLLTEHQVIDNPTDITYYFNSERADVLDSLRKTKKNGTEEYFSFNYWYLREVLNAGQNETCILDLDQFYEDLTSSNTKMTKEWNYFFTRLEVVANIRLGEEINCLTNHTANSCILPIAKDGVHLDKSGSNKAIALINELLINYPEDLELIWLLNICHQTVGTYPDGIEKQFLIEPKIFKGNEGLVEKFQDLAPQLGIATKGISGGSIMDDFNNDGFLDIVATSSGKKQSDQTRLFLNDGNGGFIDQTDFAGLKGLVGGLNASQTDYNNDGLLDIFIMRGGWFGKWGKHPNSLLKNNGDGTFTDVTKEAGLLSFNPTQTSVWADFNNDGWLDVFIGNESTAPKGRERAFSNLVNRCELYINQKDGTFKNLAKEVGIDFSDLIKGVAAPDVNNDNLPDLYISIMGGTNKLLINKGNLKFIDQTVSWGVPEPFVSFPVGHLDYNNDGWDDLIISSYTTSSNSLAHEIAYEFLGNTPVAAVPRVYKNNGDNTFTDVTKDVGMVHSIYGMGFNYGDLDNDGYLDLYFGTGDPNFESIIPNRMFKNIAGKYFEEVSFQGGFANIQKGHGISWGDIDNDGDEDIYITMGGAHEGDVYQNQLLINPLTQGNWLNIKLIGVQSNKAAIGAKIHVTTSEGQEIYRRVSSGASFGANSLALEIGLSNAESITTLEITWPSGLVQKLENIKANQRLEITESSEEYKIVNTKRIEFDKTAKSLHMQDHD